MVVIGPLSLVIRVSVGGFIVSDTTTTSNGGSVSDLELAGVKLAERGELVEFALKLFRDGFSEFEIRPAVSKLIDSKKWEGYSQLSRFGIVQAAKELWRKSQPAAAAGQAEEPVELQVVSLADVAPEPVKWLWPGKIPLGKVTVVYGAAGLGKTCWALDLAARVSAGVHWPKIKLGPPVRPGPPPAPGKVLLLNGEDHPGQTVQPRLAGSGADLQKISIVAGLKPGSAEDSTQEAAAERSLDLGCDLTALRRQIELLGDVRLVVIDPLEVYCGMAGPRGRRMRTLLAGLEKLAAEFQLAVVVISASTKCELPVKYVWRIDCDVLDAGLRWWVPVRFHSGPLPGGMAFRITAESITWDRRPLALNPDQVKGCTAKEERQQRLQEIVSWLRLLLLDGPRSSKEILRAAAGAGWSAAQAKRAKRALLVMSYKETGRRGRWMWHLGPDWADLLPPPPAPMFPDFLIPATETPVPDQSVPGAPSSPAAHEPSLDDERQHARQQFYVPMPEHLQAATSAKPRTGPAAKSGIFDPRYAATRNSGEPRAE